MDPVGKRPIVHLELHTRRLNDARAFYSALCGWETERIETPAGPYLALDLGEGIGGGIVQCLTERALWLPYIAVSQIHHMTARAVELGADELLAPREGPAGWRSVVATPAGGEVALWQAKR